MSVRLRLVLAWVLLTASLFGWPHSAVTFAKHEPQFILGLSWLAIILTAVDLLATTDVRKQEDKED